MSAAPTNVRSLADILQCNRHVRFGSLADIVCAKRDVRFVPKADTIPTLLDNLIGALLERQGHVEAKSLRSLEVDHKLELSWLQYW
jgi:hypothetical protein